MSYYCAVADSAATAADLVAALQLASDELGDELDAMIHPANQEAGYTGGLFVCLDANHYPEAVYTAMLEEADAAATLATSADVSAWKAANYVGDPPGE